MQQSFEDLLREKLSAPVRDKNKAVITKEDGTPMTPMEAMVTSVVNNAMKGDIASIAFIRNMTREGDPLDDRRSREEHARRLAEKVTELRVQLEQEGAWDGQTEEVTQLAETALLITRLDAIKAAPDFVEVLTDARTGKQTISPVITLRDDQQDRFDRKLDKLRQDAVRRKVQRMQLKR